MSSEGYKLITSQLDDGWFFRIFLKYLVVDLSFLEAFYCCLNLDLIDGTSVQLYSRGYLFNLHCLFHCNAKILISKDKISNRFGSLYPWSYHIWNILNEFISRLVIKHEI